MRCWEPGTAAPASRSSRTTRRRTATRPWRAERADKHRVTASTYGAIRREIEQHQALPTGSREEIEAGMAAIRARLDKTAKSAPDVPAGIWNKARAAIEETKRPEGFRRES